ncbi:MAG TPA: hypothetical protein VN622_16880 [Clostridia bacterium]|nr:hypothetical protein [Clostridia bacterium]
MRILLPIAALFTAAMLIACGGGSSSSTPAQPPGTGGGGTTNPTGALVTPTPVTPAAGGSVTGVDITVPAKSPTLNVTVLGVAESSSSGGTASNTGGLIHRGSSMRIIMFGPGLSANSQISISGPPDISIGTVQAITSTKGTPGAAFLATVDGAAALGARTVIVRDSNDNVSTFTGGLEVIP